MATHFVELLFVVYGVMLDRLAFPYCLRYRFDNLLFVVSRYPMSNLLV